MRTGSRTWVIVAALTCGLMLAGHLDAAGAGTSRRRSSSGQSWIVVQVLSPKGEVSYEAIRPSALQDRIARAQNEYVKAVESWKKDKSLAAANKTKFEEKKPAPGYVSRVPTTPAAFSSQNRAEAVVLALTRQMEERKKGKGTR